MLVCLCVIDAGALLGLWNNEEGYRKAYTDKLPGYFQTVSGGGRESGCLDADTAHTQGDACYVDEDGYHHIMARIDDVINVAGESVGERSGVEVECSMSGSLCVVQVIDCRRGRWRRR